MRVAKTIEACIKVDLRSDKQFVVGDTIYDGDYEVQITSIKGVKLYPDEGRMEILGRVKELSKVKANA